MDYKSSVSKRLNEYRKIQSEIIAMEEVIKDKREELYGISKEVVTVRLNDLIQELSKLSGISVSQIEIKIDTLICYYGVLSKESLKKLRSNSTEDDVLFDDNTLVIKLVGRKVEDRVLKEKFNYVIYLRFDMDEIQANGKTLYDHMSVRKNIYSKNRRYYTKFVVDKNLSKIILDIPVEYLVHEDKEWWNPADLFTQAVLNCANKSYNSRNQFVRTRARKNNR